jgi:hypothetical protein
LGIEGWHEATMSREGISWLIFVALLVLLAILAGYALQELNKPML